eukprot:gene41104-50870_t
MLTMLIPAAIKEILRFPGGIHCVRLSGESIPRIILKLPTNFLLSMKVNKGFKIYVVPVAASVPAPFAAGPGGTIQLAALRLDASTQRVVAGGRQLSLGRVDFRLLHFLMRHPERVYSRAQLLDLVWGADACVDERTVDAHIGRLRSALQPSGHQDHIETAQAGPAAPPPIRLRISLRQRWPEQAGAAMEQTVILSKREQEYLLGAIEASLSVHELRSYFLWTQGQLQALLPHRLMVCMRFSPAGPAGTAVSAFPAISPPCWRMWSVFGNPLFPQFNDLFRAPLAAPIGIGDTGWIPKGLAEKLLWPFIFTVQPRRTIEIFIVPLIWPMLYLAFGWLALALLRRATARIPLAPASPLAPRVRYTLLFMALAYLVWLNLFGIYRYLMPLEVLAPLALWLIVQHLSAHWAEAPRRRAARLAAGALLLAAVAGQVHGNWGHARWTLAGIDATVPTFAAPRESMVLTVHGNPPMGWLVPFFPAELAFVALGGGFPESPGYLARTEAMMAARSGPFYVMMTAAAPQRTARGAAAAAERGGSAQHAFVFLTVVRPSTLTRSDDRS